MPENNDPIKKITTIKKYISDLMKLIEIEYQKKLEDTNRFQAFSITSGQINDLLTELEIDIIKQQYKKE